MLSGLSYDLDDYDIANDILLIQGAVGAEILIRGVSPDSVKRYARRSTRIDRPLAVDQATGQTLVEEQLDRYCFEAINPMCKLRATIPIITDALFIAAFTLNISDQVTMQVPVMGMDEDFWVDEISFTMWTTQYIELQLGLTEVA
jgi:hypothetical protein